MTTCDILKELRQKHNLTQEELAERVLVTRQAVSRWETGETQPNTETLKLLSREYSVKNKIKARQSGLDFEGKNNGGGR